MDVISSPNQMALKGINFRKGIVNAFQSKEIGKRNGNDLLVIWSFPLISHIK